MVGVQRPRGGWREALVGQGQHLEHDLATGGQRADPIADPDRVTRPR